MGLMPWEKTTTCPYNPSHQITVSRIQKHLVKCRRNHKDSELIICPYNASHHIPKSEERYHLAHCCDRRIVELDKYSWAMERPGRHGYLEPPPSRPEENQQMSLFLDDEEDWDRELRGARIKSYDPQKKCEKSNVLRRLQGATPSQRKEFREKEKIRHEELKTVKEGNARREEEEEDSKGGFHSPRPSLFTQESLARPSTLKDRKSSELLGSVAEDRKGSRQDSITSRLLNLVPPIRKSTTLREAVTEDLSVNDSLDSALGRMVLSGGGERNANSVETAGIAPLRRPKLDVRSGK